MNYNLKQEYRSKEPRQDVEGKPLKTRKNNLNENHKIKNQVDIIQNKSFKPDMR